MHIYNMKRKILSLVLSILILQGCTENKEAPQAEQNRLDKTTSINAETAVKKAHPLSIEAIRNRTFPKGIITIEQDLGDQGNFSSYIASYKSDGLKVLTLLNIPHGASAENQSPVVIVNHGYIPPANYSTIYSYKRVSDYYADQGFIVLKPDYRGHGNSETNTTNRLSRISYPIDVLNLLYALESIDSIDMDNIFLYGHSMGGGITLTILESTDFINAATLWAPVSEDFPESILYFVRKRSETIAEQYLADWKKAGFSEDDFPTLSQRNYLEYITTPILLQHGTDDESVPYFWSTDLEAAFKKAGTKYTFLTYQDEDHNFSRGRFMEVLRKDVEFFKQHMK